MHIVAIPEKEVIDLTIEGLWFMCMESSIMWFISSALVLDLTAYTRDFICPQR